MWRPLMKPWLLIDLSYLAHRARYALDGLQFQDLPTGVLFGFFEQLRTICHDERCRSNRVAMFFDSKHTYRKKDFPDYKAHRKDKLTEEEVEQLHVMYQQVKLLRTEILPAIGFPIYQQTGCESDDLMAIAAREFKGLERQAVIITADGDLWQCITPAVHWYDPCRKRYLDPDGFRTEKGLRPEQWKEVKALAGCDGDGVPGIPGVGTKTAVDYLLGKLNTGYKRAKAIVSPEGRAIYERNKGLVFLPHPKTKPISLLEPEYKAEEFFKMAERYGLLSFLKEPKRGEWMEFFKPLSDRSRTRGLLDG